MLDKYEWILFDLDNTLLDFSQVSKIAFAASLASFDVKADKLYEVYFPINAKYWQYFEKGKINAHDLQIGRFKEFIATTNLELDATKMGGEYLNQLVSNSKWIAGAKDFLERVKETHQLVIITNGLSKAQHRRLEKHNMKRYFNHVFISEEMNVSKPNSLYFQKVYDTINCLDKSKILVVGDNPDSDIKGGRNFGLDTLWYNYKKDKKRSVNSTYQISSWSEIL